MKITLTSKLKSASFPLPIYKSRKIAEAVSKSGEIFSILAGLDKKLVLQLKNLSLDKKDKELQKNTGDRKRFGEGSYAEWYKKNRVPFALVHTVTNTLAALVWFGPKSLGQKSIRFFKNQKLEKKAVFARADDWHTIAFRSYPPFRGKGLTKEFVAFCTYVYMKKFSNIKIWAGIDTYNAASEKLSLGLGFKTLERLSDRKAHWLVMVKY